MSLLIVLCPKETYFFSRTMSKTKVNAKQVNTLWIIIIKDSLENASIFIACFYIKTFNQFLMTKNNKVECYFSIIEIHYYSFYLNNILNIYTEYISGLILVQVLEMLLCVCHY